MKTSDTEKALLKKDKYKEKKHIEIEKKYQNMTKYVLMFSFNCFIFIVFFPAPKICFSANTTFSNTNISMPLLSFSV